MIDRDEIEYQAEQLDVHVANVERDYVFGWLLKAISENPHLGSALIFKGGNCMRKAYYPDTRFSGDLDFSVETSVDADRMIADLNSVCSTVEDQSGVRFVTDRTTFAADRALDRERTSYKGSLYFHDFYGQPSKLVISVRLDVSDYERLYLPSVSRSIFHPYSDEKDCVASVRCMALEELVANKLKCLLQRRHSFDLYDLVYAAFFERSIELNRSEVVSTFLKKTIFERSPGAAKDILLGLPIPLMKGAWEKYIAAPLRGRFAFADALSAFPSIIEGLFEGVFTRDLARRAFFGPEHRNLIMEAGAGKRLMQLRYGERTRIIEPYALCYKRAAGKDPAEYFYAFDRSEHGRGPSIKSFLNEGVQGLEILDETFEPQFEIELSKAGEPSKRSHFSKAFGGQTSRTRKTAGLRVSRFPSRQQFSLRCPYCERTFKRSSRSTALNPHKDRAGYPCFGRNGYFV
jgi:predicted nucleotidyltransferase component of viral defense system